MTTRQKYNIKIGGRFGRWLVESNLFIFKNKSHCRCICDCGVKSIVIASMLLSGRSKSCGCWKADKAHGHKKHGMAGSRVYRAWQHMISRCYRQTESSYKNYGARGIKVCKCWHTFENFLKDMGEPSTNMTLDRINNNKNYIKSNCRWASRKIQARNRRSNRRLKLNGIVKVVTEWAEELNISRDVINSRLRRGWSVEKTLNTPHILIKR